MHFDFRFFRYIDFWSYQHGHWGETSFQHSLHPFPPSAPSTPFAASWNKQFSPENWGHVKSIDVPTKMKHSTVLVWGKPTPFLRHLLCRRWNIHHAGLWNMRPANSVLHIWLGHTKIFGIAAPMTRRKPVFFFTLSRLSRESSTCVSVCVLSMVYPKNLPSHGSQFSQIQVESQISPDRSNKCRHSSLQLSPNQDIFLSSPTAGKLPESRKVSTWVTHPLPNLDWSCWCFSENLVASTKTNMAAWEINAFTRKR